MTNQADSRSERSIALAVAVERHGGRSDIHDGAPRWWVTNPDEEAVAAAAKLGLVPARELLQMRRALPLEPEVLNSGVHHPATPNSAEQLEVRAFDPTTDAEAFLEVNNSAFDWHPDQGNWTNEILAERMAEPWFNLDDFRVGKIDGSLVAFCWTKVVPDADPVTGEIYVIAVSPEYHGKGLGREMTVAGLQWLSDVRHARHALLYVESDNLAAVRTYERLGFSTADIDVAFQPPLEQL